MAWPAGGNNSKCSRERKGDSADATLEKQAHQVILPCARLAVIKRGRPVWLQVKVKPATNEWLTTTNNQFMGIFSTYENTCFRTCRRQHTPLNESLR